MPGPLREPVITLAGGPWDRQAFYVTEWHACRQAAELMGRTPDEFCGWPLAYRQETPGGHRWIWTASENWPRKHPTVAPRDRPLTIPDAAPQGTDRGWWQQNCKTTVRIRV